MLLTQTLSKALFRSLWQLVARILDLYFKDTLDNARVQVRVRYCLRKFRNKMNGERRIKNVGASCGLNRLVIRVERA